MVPLKGPRYTFKWLTEAYGMTSVPLTACRFLLVHVPLLCSSGINAILFIKHTHTIALWNVHFKLQFCRKIIKKKKKGKRIIKHFIWTQEQKHFHQIQWNNTQSTYHNTLSTHVTCDLCASLSPVNLASYMTLYWNTKIPRKKKKQADICPFYESVTMALIVSSIS